jgi:hypothetical protein
VLCESTKARYSYQEAGEEVEVHFEICTHYSSYTNLLIHQQPQGGYDIQVTMDRKRKIDDTNGQTISVSKAAKFNAHTLRKLQAAVSHDPEVDLTTRMPIDYTSRLTRMQTSKEVLGK